MNNVIIAQNNKYFGAPIIRNYLKDEYNSSPQNWATAQDSRGIMYFACTSNLLEFDGSNWTNYYLKNKTTVRSIDIDTLDNIWVGGYNEFGYFSHNNNGKLEYSSISEKLKKSQQNFGDILRIFATPDGVYFITRSSIIRWFDNKITILHIILKPTYAFEINNHIYIIDYMNGIAELNGLTREYLPKTTTSIFGKGNINACEYTKNKILIVTKYNGFYVYDIETENLIKQETQPEIINYLSTNSTSFSLIKNGTNYALSTINGGILIFNEKLELIDIVNEPRGLSSNCVYNLFIDKDNNMWAGLQNGISHIEIQNPVRKFEKEQGINGIILDAINYNKIKYVATLQGCYYLPPYSLNPTNDNHKFNSIANLSNCWDFEIFQNKLLVGGTFGIVQIIDTIQNNIIDSRKNIYCFGESSKFPNYLFTGSSNGLSAVEIVPDSNSIYLKTKNSITFKKFDYKVRKIVSDENGNLWLRINQNTIAYIRFTGQTIEEYEITIFGNKSGLPNSKIMQAIFINNKINIFSDKGIYKPILNNKTQIYDSLTHFEHDNFWGTYFTKDSANCSNIFKIKDDQYILEGNPCAFVNFSKEEVIVDKIPFIDIPNNVIVRVEKDYINFLTSNSFYIYDLKKKIIEPKQYQTLIRKITIAKDSTIYYGCNFSNNYTQDKIPVIDYENNSLNIYFSAIFYKNSEKTLYSYYIDGHSKEWSYWASETKAVLINLPEGKYTFKVKAKNIYEKESQITEFKFEIRPPWHRTIFAIIIYAVLLILLIYVIIKVSTQRVVKAKIKLEGLVKKRTAEIFLQKEEIQSQTELLKKTNYELFQQHEELIAQNDKLEFASNMQRAQSEEMKATTEELSMQAKLLYEANEKLEKLSIVASETINAVLIFDENFNLQWENNAYCKIYGISYKEMAKNKDLNLIKNSSNPNIKDVIAKCISEKKSITYELPYNDETMWIQTSLTPIFYNEKFSKIIAVETDITEIKKVHQEISEKNQQISSSIRYAKTIQQAILPDNNCLNKLFNNFIIFKPKDVVSGDFYWFTNIDNTLNNAIIAVVDCTGHGIPGAFMSLIGNNLLNEIVKQRKIIDPKKILFQLDVEIRKSLKQDMNKNMDGMDMCLCSVKKINDKETKIVFSGAKNPLFYYKFIENKLYKLTGDRKSIGGYYQHEQIKFTNQEIILHKNDIIYLTTDGYIAQNNKARRRFGTKRLKAILHQNAAKELTEQKQILETELAKWQETEMQLDDITVVGIKI